MVRSCGNQVKKKPLCIIENVTHTILELSKHADEYLIHTSGCCMAIRMEYVNQKLNYCFPGWAHDDFFWKMGILDGSLAYIHTNSVLHRITGVNESRKKSTLEKAIWSSEIDIQIAKELLQRLHDESISNSDEKIVLIKHKLEGAKLRLKMLKCKSPLIALKLMINYQDLYRKKRPIIGDYLRSLHIMN